MKATVNIEKLATIIADQVRHDKTLCQPKAYDEIVENILQIGEQRSVERICTGTSPHRNPDKIFQSKNFQYLIYDTSLLLMNKYF